MSLISFEFGNLLLISIRATQVLIIDGKSARLKDKEDGKEYVYPSFFASFLHADTFDLNRIASSTWNGSKLTPGDIKQIGGKTVEVPEFRSLPKELPD